MKALRFEQGGLKLADVAPPSLPGEALVRVTHSGICNTDLEIVRGHDGAVDDDLVTRRDDDEVVEDDVVAGHEPALAVALT